MPSTLILERRISSLEKQVQDLAADKYLDAEQVREILNCSLLSVYKMFNSPEFPSRKIPGVGWRVKQSQLIKYIESIT